MPPKKGTKAYREEYVYAHYGINMNTLGVQTVLERRDGTLSGGSANHYVMPGRHAASELIIVFNLTDVRTLPIHMMQSHGDEVKKELEQLAAKKREERDRSASDPNPDSAP